ncbi:uncharacterized protein RSE6_11076 [Rhynchosporium secalis]|uniref:Uncharacterized protein n=1 Tax=Rhynchosporium secalis TaxID=38038 RepID=A0A1E1MM30_RHYSE|nr:uncharacterized protein RSE6_11076 [Rhynchosporium secalis]
MASINVSPPDNFALASTSVPPTRKGGHAIRTRKLLKFTIFGKLPLELRDPDGDRFFEKFTSSTPCRYESRAKFPPFILRTSHEARGIGLRHYSLNFGITRSYTYGDVRIEVSSPAQIYVNWDCDIICPQTVNQSLSLEEEEMNNVFWYTPLFKKIRRIAFEVGLGDVDHWDPGHILSSHNILEVILYPAINSFTERLHDDKGVITRKRMSIELVSLDAYLDGGAFPDRFKIADTGILERTHEKIRKKYHTCYDDDCIERRKRVTISESGEQAGVEVQKEAQAKAEEDVEEDVDVCTDLSHSVYPFLVLIDFRENEAVLYGGEAWAAPMIDLRMLDGI